MRKIFLVLLGCIFIAITSCKKIGKSQIDGTVTEKGTGLPFPNIAVYLESSTKSGMNSKTNPTIIDSSITDANGHYNLSFFMRLNYLYRVYCKPTYCVNNMYSGIAGNGLPTKNITKDFVLPPFAYLKINLHKTSSSITDYADFIVDYSNSIALDVPNYPFDRLQGVYRVKGNDSIVVSWVQNYNTPSVYVNHSEKKYIAKGDTLTYLINLN